MNYNRSNIITISPNQTQSVEFSFDGHNEITAVLVDASNQATIDTVKIKKSNARDLGGLI